MPNDPKPTPNMTHEWLFVIAFFAVIALMFWITLGGKL